MRNSPLGKNSFISDFSGLNSGRVDTELTELGNFNQVKESLKFLHGDSSEIFKTQIFSGPKVPKFDKNTLNFKRNLNFKLFETMLKSDSQQMPMAKQSSEKLHPFSLRRKTLDTLLDRSKTQKSSLQPLNLPEKAKIPKNTVSVLSSNLHPLQKLSETQRRFNFQNTFSKSSHSKPFQTTKNADIKYRVG